MTETLARCPFLEEIDEVYCEAAPRRKPIPRDRLSDGSPCTGEGYRACPAYREQRAKEGFAPDDGGGDPPPAAP